MTDDTISRVAEAVQRGGEAFWDFGEHYAVLNRLPDFSYRELSRAVKERHGVDLPHPSMATRVRKAYEKYVLECGIPLSRMKQHSPYTVYELMVHTDVTPTNVHEWLAKASRTPRDELLADLKDADSRPQWEHFRVEAGVYEMMNQARIRLAQSVGYEPDKMSPTVYFEFLSELVINTDEPLLRSLWRQMHGEGDEG